MRWSPAAEASVAAAAFYRARADALGHDNRGLVSPDTDINAGVLVFPLTE
jgi:hypothetical protein